MNRDIKSIRYKTSSVRPDPEFVDNPRQWLENWLSQHAKLDIRYLLAHADDGVIWGYTEDNHLHLSGDYFSKYSPPLSGRTLQQLWLFGPVGELHIWKTAPSGFEGRVIEDSGPEDSDSVKAECFDEPQILWGNRIAEVSNPRQNGFTLVAEGQGLHHAVPRSLPSDTFDIDGKPARSLRLQLRHYLTTDDLGQARIHFSRLVNIVVEGEENNGR